ncbi:hypothetical protein HDU88_004108 [Geranomyces variabilis]|nr:hypothetical protein HDU88_004108 [Geranomyces variabilis]
MRRYEDKLNLRVALMNAQGMSPCKKNEDCGCYVCNWRKMDEVPMVELDRRFEPFSGDKAKRAFKRVAPGYPVAEPHRDLDPCCMCMQCIPPPEWCADTTSKKYRNARQRYIEHPYPMTELEEIWHMRPVAHYEFDQMVYCIENNRPTEDEFEYDPALLIADESAGRVEGRPRRYVTVPVEMIVDFDMIDAVKQVFPMRMHLNATEGCFTVRHRRPANDKSGGEFVSHLAGISQHAPGAVVTCVDRELIKNFRPHQDLPSVEALTSTGIVSDAPQFLWNSIADGTTQQSDGENADEMEHQGVVESPDDLKDDDNHTTYGTNSGSADDVANDGNVEIPEDIENGADYNQDQAHEDGQVIEDDEEEDDDDDDEDDEDAEAIERMLRQMERDNANPLTRQYESLAWPKLNWDSDSDSESGSSDYDSDENPLLAQWMRDFRNHPEAFAYYNFLTHESDDEDTHQPIAYQNLQLELLFYIASRSPSDYQVFFNVPLSVRVDFRAALLFTALGPRFPLPPEIIRMIAAADPAVIHFAHLEGQSFINFPRISK